MKRSKRIKFHSIICANVGGSDAIFGSLLK